MNEPIKLTAVLKKQYTKRCKQTELNLVDPLSNDVHWDLDTLSFEEYRLKACGDSQFVIIDT